MIISFFEEFPTAENLQKFKLVSWPTKLYLAAHSVPEFEQICSSIPRTRVVETIYWPILKKEEGYWISPFSDRAALHYLFHELDDFDGKVMLDLELPISKHPLLLLTQLPHFRSNKRFIASYLNRHPATYLAEYFPEGRWKEFLLSSLGLHFSPQRHGCNIVKMIYQSMHVFPRSFVQDELKRGVTLHGKNFLVAFGTIATGILGNEPLLSLQQLEEDLSIAQSVGVHEVVIFRLGGLNQQYAAVLKKFVQKTI
ncbi:hypothetical protein HZB02_00015 [Candidatus Woesearchaeota archaeon]|nr:hypothetical protein [Candidatus Woesearchaeota archaeon]